MAISFKTLPTQDVIIGVNNPVRPEDSNFFRITVTRKLSGNSYLLFTPATIEVANKVVFDLRNLILRRKLEF